MYLDVLVQALTAGSIYALVGVSVNVIYRPTNTFNLAQGNLVMLGAILCATILGQLKLPWYLAAGITVVVISGIAWLTHLVAVAPILSRPGGGGHGWLVSTLAVGILIEDAVGKIVGPDPQRLPPPPPLSTELGALGVSSYQVALVAGVVAIVAALEIFYRSRTGRAILAIAEDRDASLLWGIDPTRLARMSFVLSGVVAALAGILAGPVFYASVGLGGSLLIKGFEAAAAGGIGSNRGVILAGFFIALLDAITARALAPGYQDAVSFVAVLLLLLVRPQGLMGRTNLRTV
ncbi:MAG: branched-chain amino acid ABC transporter permease [Alphaproteobacteria bacterium]|nr:branched-chain amino acid ABC transporter permease [Alphaproteobacteria bacterium]